MPEALIVGGPSGAGKSTVAREYLRGRDVPFLGAEGPCGHPLVVRHRRANQHGAPRGHGRASGPSVSARVGGPRHTRQGLVVESTLAGQGPRRWLKELREAGYMVTIVFLFVDAPETSIRRVEERVRKGGHHVPNEAPDGTLTTEDPYEPDEPAQDGEGGR